MNCGFRACKFNDLGKCIHENAELHCVEIEDTEKQFLECSSFVFSMDNACKNNKIKTLKYYYSVLNDELTCDNII